MTGAEGGNEYFALKPPEGQAGNWLQTVPGKSWWLALRMYGPLEPWINQTWQPSEIELVNERGRTTTSRSRASSAIPSSGCSRGLCSPHRVKLRGAISQTETRVQEVEDPLRAAIEQFQVQR